MTFRAFLLLLLVCWLSPALSADDASMPYPQARNFFPSADHFGPFEGEPLAAAAFRGDEVLGYVLRTNDVTPIPAYSGKPINQLVGIDLTGEITGVVVLEHHEPILLVGIPETQLTEFVIQYIGKSVRDHLKVGSTGREGYVNIDAITGATVTVMVMNEVILRASREVAISRGILPPPASESQAPARVRSELFEVADWKTLTGNGAIRRLRLTRGEVDASFVGTEGEDVETASPSQTEDVFADLYYTYLNAPTIGRNLLGESEYNWLMAELKPGDHAIAVLGNGPYSFKGSGYVRGGIFDRILLAQNDAEISFRDLDYFRLNDITIKDAPRFNEKAIFIIRAEHEFDPGAAWRLELLIKRQTGPLESVFSSFGAEYLIPEAYVEKSEPIPVVVEDEAIWKQVWRERTFQIGVLLGGLILLSFIMGLQDILVRFPRLMVGLRIGFQLYTLFFIGWYLLGQLSIVNVFTFAASMMQGFHWDTFLIDPTMFILWVFVAGSLLLWGRGVYCGWLCPFGALQKLVNELARKIKVPQYDLPQIIHDRLWGIKYLIFMALFGISLQSIGAAERYAEIEPFKTAITLRFAREWGFVLYAVVLVLISAFNCKFYCKYICPLGAALAVPAKMSLVNWLRRRKECGHPCKICANECEIQAIDDNGAIIINECHYCMDCQVTYWDNHKCPPLVDKRKRMERARKIHSKNDQDKNGKKVSALESIPIEVN